MKISGILTPYDYIRFYTLESFSFKRRDVIIILFIVGIISLTKGDYNIINILFICCILFIFLKLFTLTVQPLFILFYSFILREKTYTKDVTFDFTEDAIVSSIKDTATTSYLWKKASKLRETKNHYFLYIENNKCAYILPKRFFSKEQEQTFKILVDKKLQENNVS